MLALFYILPLLATLVAAADDGTAQDSARMNHVRVVVIISVLLLDSSQQKLQKKKQRGGVSIED